MTEIQPKLEKKPRPDKFCPDCFGYGYRFTRDRRLDTNERAWLVCERCGGGGWVYGKNG